jgi:hypothetical protein
VELDHVVIAVRDLAAAAADFEAQYGLSSVEGGRHPGWGTANRIVPLGDAYLELIAVVDEVEAAGSGLGSWVANGLGGSDARLIGWVVRTDDLDAIAARLRLSPQAGSRTRPDGAEVRWRAAGVERAAAERCFPFFIEWADDVALPGRSDRAVGAIRRLDLVADPVQLSAWLGEHSLPISVERGQPAVRRVVVDVRGRSVAIGD